MDDSEIKNWKAASVSRTEAAHRSSSTDDCSKFQGYSATCEAYVVNMNQEECSSPVEPCLNTQNGLTKVERPYKCGNCEYRAKRNDTLRSHVKAVHLKLKPYHCSLCAYRAARKRRLEEHVQVIHFSEKTLMCPECEYTAVLPEAIRKHVKFVHMKLRPHKCPECDYKAALPSALRIHLKVIHLKENDECPDFGYNVEPFHENFGHEGIYRIQR
ncbi:zinc finger autosomal protein isoform X2 [Halyomorpha halys]|uniref:zinc finger autosomal protein isoform X2 n=1 Tax=Halyomorpha halys TaxID=286706 RepID=UPI0006D4F0EC|nr:zinc finger Y-chromosomal protein-like isoform X2 [Halyomorpha halys]